MATPTEADGAIGRQPLGRRNLPKSPPGQYRDVIRSRRERMEDLESSGHGRLAAAIGPATQTEQAADTGEGDGGWLGVRDDIRRRRYAHGSVRDARRKRDALKSAVFHD